jgi:hypothetical protein
VQYVIRSKTCGLVNILPTSNRTQQVAPMETTLNMFSGDPGSNLYPHVSFRVSNSTERVGGGAPCNRTPMPLKHAIRKSLQSYSTGHFSSYRSTLRLPWFYHGFSSVVRQIQGYNSQRRGTARTSQITFQSFFPF